MALTNTKVLQLLLLVVIVAAVARSSLVARAQNCGPAANGNKCANDCCSKYGYCGTGNDYCGSGCQKDYGKCNDCFPGHAMVLTRGGTQKPISQLSIGEEVGVWIGKDGEVQYDAVYAFGHADSEPLSEFIAITMRNGNITNKIQLTPDHFVLVMISKGNMHYKKAKDVVIGDKMMVINEEGLEFLVIGLEKEILQGLFNPFTMRGTILVNNVLASCHSRWFLDTTFDRIGLSHFLPPTYQAFLGPVRMIYKRMGEVKYKSLYTNLDARYNIPKSGTPFTGYLNLLGHVFFSKSIKGESGHL